MHRETQKSNRWLTSTSPLAECSKSPKFQNFHQSKLNSSLGRDGKWTLGPPPALSYYVNGNIKMRREKYRRNFHNRGPPRRSGLQEKLMVRMKEVRLTPRLEMDSICERKNLHNHEVSRVEINMLRIRSVLDCCFKSYFKVQSGINCMGWGRVRQQVMTDTNGSFDEEILRALNILNNFLKKVNDLQNIQYILS